MCARGQALALVLFVLAGCRDDERSTAPAATRETPAELAKSTVAPETSPVVVPAPETKPVVVPAPETKPVVVPAPAPEPVPDLVPMPDPVIDPTLDETLLDVAGRTVAVRLDVEESTDEETPPSRSLVVRIDGATQGTGVLSLVPTFEWCYQNEAVVEPVPGVASPLVLAQAFCTNGEDEFSREILSAVIHIGDATTAPRVLWQGEGSYGNSFGLCEHFDVPVAEVTRPGMLVVEQVTEVIAYPNPDRLGDRCRARKERRRKLAELAF